MTTCPKCGRRQPLSDACVDCGIIFSKYHQGDTDVSSGRTLQPSDSGDVLKKTETVSTASSRKPPVIPLVLLVLACIAGVSIYIGWIEPYLSAGNFTQHLAVFGARELDFPEDDQSVAEGEKPYRIGKVFVIVPEHYVTITATRATLAPPEIHQAWYGLGHSMRASKPEDVDTLIQISKKIRQTKRYQKIGGLSQKVVSTHIVYLDVYNWRNKTFIGRWTLDPGTDIRDTMTEDELNELIRATSIETIQAFIESMPERKP